MAVKRPEFCCFYAFSGSAADNAAYSALPFQWIQGLYSQHRVTACKAYFQQNILLRRHVFYPMRKYHLCWYT